MDYDLLLVCANWPGSRHEAWTTLLHARAIENMAYVVGVNRVGEDGCGITYSGNSAAVDFKGLDMVSAQENGTQVVVAELDREALLSFRSRWPFYLDFDK